MKNKLNIFTNNNINSFVSELLSKYELTFLKLEDIDYKEQSTNVNVVIIINDKDANKIKFKNLNNNYLIISNLHYKKLDLNNSFQTLNIPTSANNIKNKIENFIQSLKFYFHDIAIDNEKLTNNLQGTKLYYFLRNCINNVNSGVCFF